MPAYINHEGQQTGPFDDHVVIEQLRSGQLSPDDLSIRTGDAQWQTLRTMFPNSVVHPISPAQAVSATEAQYRKTVFPKVFFGMCLVVEIIVILILAFYFYGVIDPSRNLAHLLDKSVIGILFVILSGNFTGGFLTLLAFLMAFKRRIVRSNGLRIGIRTVSVLVLLFGLGNVGLWGYQLYVTNHAYSLANTGRPEALFFGLHDMMLPYGMGLIFLPIAVGLFLFGLSGIMMAKRARA